MLIFVGFIILGIILSYITNYFHRHEDNNIGFIGWLICFMTLTLGMAFVISPFICSNYPKQQKIVSSDAIYNLSDNTEIKGQQFLFRTDIDSVEYYKFYVKTDKGMELNKVQCDGTYIIESDKETPRIEYINVSYKTNNWICFDTNGSSYCRIYVPNNTIIKDYNIDMK